MNIENLREMNWREKKKLVETTGDMQLLMSLAEDKSVFVKKAILKREDAALEVLEKVYDNFEKAKERERVITVLRNFAPSEVLRKFLGKMVSDPEPKISFWAIRKYRDVFKNSIKRSSEDIWDASNQEILEDWAIQIIGYGEQCLLADNPNLTGENAHKFVVTLLTCDTNPNSVERDLYRVFSHEGILDKTVEYVFNWNFKESRKECFHFNPKFVVAKRVSTEKLGKLMDLYEYGLEHAYTDKMNMEYYAPYFYRFCIALLQNPNCSKEIFDKAFDVFVRRYRISWTDHLRLFAMSEHISKEQFIYIMKEYSKAFFLCKEVPEKFKMLTESEFAEIASGFTDHAKDWIKEYAPEIPAEFLLYISK